MSFFRVIFDTDEIAFAGFVIGLSLDILPQIIFSIPKVFTSRFNAVQEPVEEPHNEEHNHNEQTIDIDIVVNQNRSEENQNQENDKNIQINHD